MGKEEEEKKRRKRMNKAVWNGHCPPWHVFFFLGPGGGPCGSRAHVGCNHSFAHFVIVPARHSHVEGSFVMANMGSL